MNFGVDMVKVKVTDFRVHQLKGGGWRRKSTEVDSDPEPFGFTSTGEPLSGGYFLNRSSKGDKPNMCCWEVTKWGVTCEVNPSTLKHPWGLTTDLQPTFEAMKQDMELLGIDFDLEQARVNRVDLTKQSVMEHPTPTYHPALASMKGQRMGSTKYEDGMSFGNRQREFVFYDKAVQLIRERGIYEAPDNLLRLEARWKKPQVISHDKRGHGLGIGVFSDLLSRSSVDLNLRYIETVQKQLFRTPEGTQLSFDFGQGVDMLRVFVKAAGRGGWKNYVMAEGVERVLHQFGSLDTFEMALLQVEYSPKQARRIVDELRGNLLRKGRHSRDKQTLAGQIEILRQTFAA